MGDKPHLSITQLKMISFCGEQYRRRYICGEKIPPGISLLVGRSVDNAITKNLSHKIDTGDLLPLEEIQDITRDDINTQFNTNEITFTEEEISEGIKTVKGKAIDKAISLSATHAKKLAPQINPTHVQRKIELELEGFPFDILGYIDIQEGVESVRDTKTSSRSPAKTAADMSDQLTIYAMAVWRIDGKIPQKLTLDYLVNSGKSSIVPDHLIGKIRASTTKIVILETSREIKDFQPLLQRIEKAAEVIEKGVFMPAPQDSYLCNPRFCGYAMTCPYYRK